MTAGTLALLAMPIACFVLGIVVAHMAEREAKRDLPPAPQPRNPVQAKHLQH
jgi:hypothetical protein